MHTHVNTHPCAHTGFSCVQRKQHSVVTDSGYDDVLVTVNRPHLTSDSHDRTSAEHVLSGDILAETCQKLEVGSDRLAPQLEDNQQPGYSNLLPYDDLPRNLDENSAQDLQEVEDSQSTLEPLEDKENVSTHLVGKPSTQQLKGDRQSVKHQGYQTLNSSDDLLSHQLQTQQPKGEDYQSIENRDEQSDEHFDSESNQSAKQLKDEDDRSALSPEDDDQPLQQLEDKQLERERCSSTQQSGDKVDKPVQELESENGQIFQEDVRTEHYPQSHDNRESKHSLSEKCDINGTSTVETEEGTTIKNLYLIEQYPTCVVILYNMLYYVSMHYSNSSGNYNAGDIVVQSLPPSDKQRLMVIPVRQVIGMDQVQDNQQLSV